MSSKKQKVIMNETTNVVKTGVVSMAGMGAMGAISPIAGSAAAPIMGITGATVGLANLGQGLKSGSNIAKTFTTKQNKIKSQSKNRSESIVRKILG